MKKLSHSDLKLMENLVSVDQKTLRSVLYKFLKKYYNNVKKDPDFVYAIGEIPICLVAHTDTVFKKPATEVFYDREKNVMISPTGLGADDRAGVFAIIKILQAGFRPHVIFTADEEIGCVGANELSYLPCPFKDCRYMIQLDRQGSDDCVFYNCANDEFEKYIESFGFVTNFGSFTDICELCPSWGMAGVNLSIGYRDEHTVSEVLFVGQMFNTIEKVKKMLSEKEVPEFKYISRYPTYLNSWRGYGGKGYTNLYYEYPGYDDEFDNDDWSVYPYNGFKYKCSGCGKYVPEDDVLQVKLIKGGTGFFCEDCLINKADFCKECNDIYEIDRNNDYGYCKECEAKHIL